jgi:hypothetical protein
MCNFYLFAIAILASADENIQFFLVSLLLLHQKPATNDAGEWETRRELVILQARPPTLWLFISELGENLSLASLWCLPGSYVGIYCIYLCIVIVIFRIAFHDCMFSELRL